MTKEQHYYSTFDSANTFFEKVMKKIKKDNSTTYFLQSDKNDPNSVITFSVFGAVEYVVLIETSTIFDNEIQSEFFVTLILKPNAFLGIPSKIILSPYYIKNDKERTLTSDFIDSETIINLDLGEKDVTNKEEMINILKSLENFTSLNSNGNVLKIISIGDNKGTIIYDNSENITFRKEPVKIPILSLPLIHFRSKSDALIFALVYEDSRTRADMLGITNNLYHSERAAKEWKRNIEDILALAEVPESHELILTKAKEKLENFFNNMVRRTDNKFNSRAEKIVYYCLKKKGVERAKGLDIEPIYYEDPSLAREWLAGVIDELRDPVIPISSKQKCEKVLKRIYEQMITYSPDFDIKDLEEEN